MRECDRHAPRPGLERFARRCASSLHREQSQPQRAIHDYISEFDCGVANVNYVLDRLMGVVEGLAHFPDRGSDPKELVALGIKAYRQTAFKPYRGDLSRRGQPGRHLPDRR